MTIFLNILEKVYLLEEDISVQEKQKLYNIYKELTSEWDKWKEIPIIGTFDTEKTKKYIKEKLTK